MTRDWYSYLLKVAATFLVLLLIQLVYPIPTGTLIGAAFYLGLIAVLTDRLLPVTFQGWGRWATEVVIDWIALIAGSWLVVGLSPRLALLAAVAVAALDLTIHQTIALTFGIRSRRIRS
ncbi:MAG TPA: hypothetical protein VK191_13680 [Symbiobacteriaceae bacterium]|nr:hypothetical protein [Symbiobacteriaceae bacterium]